MIGKKDTLCIFEQYRNVIKEQVDDNKINAIKNAIKTSALAPEVKSGLLGLLSDPEVAAKWKGGDADTVNEPDAKFGKELSAAKYGDPDQDTANAPDPKFADEMRAAQKAQNAAYPEQDDEEYQNCHLIADPRAREICEYNKRKVGRASVAAQGRVDPNAVLRR